MATPASDGSAPVTFAAVVMTKYGQPPTFRTKRRKIVIRSDGIFVLSIPPTPTVGADGQASAAASAVVKRVVPIAKLIGVELRAEDTHILLRVRDEHDLYVSTENDPNHPRVLQDFLAGLDKAFRDANVMFHAQRKTRDIFDLRGKDQNYVKLSKDLMKYITIEEKMAVRCGLRRVEKYPPPPYTLKQWDETFTPVRGGTPRDDIPSEIKTSLEPFFIVLHGAVSVYAVLPEGVAPPAVTPPGMPGLEPQQRYMVFSPDRIQFFDPTTAPHRNRLDFTIFDVQSVTLDQPAKEIQFRLLPLPHVIHVKLLKAAVGRTFTTSDISTVAECLNALVLRHGYPLEITDRAGVRPGPGSSPPAATAPPAVALNTTGSAAKAAAPPAAADQHHRSLAADGSDDGTRSENASPRSGGRVVQFAAAIDGNSSSAAAAPAASAPTFSNSSDTVTPVRDRSKSAAMLGPTSQLDEQRLKALVKDYRAPMGEIPRLFMSQSTLIARRCLRLTSKLSWEPRVLVVSTVGVFICMEDCNVKRHIELSDIKGIVVTKHFDGEAISILVPSEFDCVVRSHPDGIRALTMNDVAATLKVLTQVEPKIDVYTGKLSLKDVVKGGRSLKKHGTFEYPAVRLEKLRSESPRNRAASDTGNSTPTSPQQTPRPATTTAASPPQSVRGADPATGTTRSAATDNSYPDIARVDSVASNAAPRAAPIATTNGARHSPASDPLLTGSMAMSEYDLGSFAGRERVSSAAEGKTAAATTASAVADPPTPNKGEEEAVAKHPVAPITSSTDSKPASATAAAASANRNVAASSPPRMTEAPRHVAVLEELPISVSATTTREGELPAERQLAFDDAVSSVDGGASLQPSPTPPPHNGQQQPATTATTTTLTPSPASAFTAQSTSPPKDKDEAKARSPTAEVAPSPAAATTSRPLPPDASDSTAAHASVIPEVVVSSADSPSRPLPLPSPPTVVDTPPPAVPEQHASSASTEPSNPLPAPAAATTVSASVAEDDETSAPPLIRRNDTSRPLLRPAAEGGATRGTPPAAASRPLPPPPASDPTAVLTTATAVADDLEPIEEDIAPAVTTSSYSSSKAAVVSTGDAVVPVASHAARGASPPPPRAAVPSPSAAQSHEKVEPLSNPPRPVSVPVLPVHLATASSPPPAASWQTASGSRALLRPHNESPSPYGSQSPSPHRFADWPSPRQLQAADISSSPRTFGYRDLGDLPAAVHHEEDAALVTSPRPDGRAWLSCRVKIRDEYFSLFTSDAFLDLIKKCKREQRKAVAVDGPMAGELAFMVCAQGPAIQCFTVSFLLMILEQSVDATLVRRDAVLVREPSADPSVVEWVQVTIPAFCALIRQGRSPSEIAAACLREMAELQHD